MKFKKPELAVKDFSKTIELDNSQDELYSLRGDAYRELGKYNDAVKDYDAAIRLNPEDPNPYIGRGLVKMETDNKDEGLEDLYKAKVLGADGVDELIIKYTEGSD